MICTFSEGFSIEADAFVSIENQRNRRTNQLRDEKARAEIFQDWPYNMVKPDPANKKIKTLHAKLWPELEKHLDKRSKNKNQIATQRMDYSERLTRALIEMAHRGGCTAVSRNKDELDQILIDVQDAYVAAGYCDVCLSKPGGTHQTRLIPLEKLKQQLSEDPWEYKKPINYYFERRKRRKKKKDKPVLLAFDRADAAIVAIQHENKIINDAHAKMVITYKPKYGRGSWARLRPVFKTIGTENTKQNCRNYTGYAGHQNLLAPKEPGEYNERATIHFDGEPSFEADYSALFISMIYHRAGHDVVGDPYWLWDEQYNKNNNEHRARRELSKLTHNTLINAKTEADALDSLENEARWFVTKAGKVKERKPAPEYKEAMRLTRYLKLTRLWFERIIDLVKQKHAAIAHIAFGRDLGIKLMAIEGKIARRVMVHFCSTRRPCLAIHDSFQVRQSDAAELVAVMRTEYFKLFYRYPKVEPDGGEMVDLRKFSISSSSNLIFNTPYLRKIGPKKTIKPDYYCQKRGCLRPNLNCSLTRHCVRAG